MSLHTELEERKIRELLEETAISEIENLYWYNADMVKLYMEVGNFRAMEKRTGIPMASCYKTVVNSFSLLKEAAEKRVADKHKKKEKRFCHKCRWDKDVSQFRERKVKKGKKVYIYKSNKCKPCELTGIVKWQQSKITVIKKQGAQLGNQNAKKKLVCQ